MVLAAVARGVAGFFGGVWNVAANPCVLKACVLRAPLIALCATVAALAAYLVSFPLRLILPAAIVGERLGLSALLRLSSLIFLKLTAAVAPYFSASPRGPFFAANSCEPSLAPLKALESKNIIRGLKHQLFETMRNAVLLLIALVVLAACLPAIAVLAATSWMFAGLALPVIIAVLIAGILGYFPFFSALSLLLGFDFRIFLLGILLYCTKLISLGNFIFAANALWYASFSSEELLTQCAIRKSAAEWNNLKKKLKWEILGFGFPVWFLFHHAPFTGILVFDALQASAAHFLGKIAAERHIEI